MYELVTVELAKTMLENAERVLADPNEIIEQVGLDSLLTQCDKILMKHSDLLGKDDPESVTELAVMNHRFMARVDNVLEKIQNRLPDDPANEGDWSQRPDETPGDALLRQMMDINYG